jgi:hypothetical protein
MWSVISISIKDIKHGGRVNERKMNRVINMLVSLDNMEIVVNNSHQ